MFNGGNTKERIVSQNRFIAITKPCPAEGVGRALQVAFRDGFELPADMLACLAKLDQID
jgi:hypothetical protein